MLKTSLGTLAIAITSLAGCKTPALTTSGPEAVSRPLACEFQLLTVVPSGSYVEKGVFEAQLGDFGSNAFSTLADFKREIAPYVCRAGGDVAVAHANRDGIYVQATILKATAAPPAPGCAFDTQCKGQRVCIKGECADPPH
jgi:hypothetical protein